MTRTSVSPDPYLRHSESVWEDLHHSSDCLYLFTFPSPFQVNAPGQSLAHETVAVSAVVMLCGLPRGMACFSVHRMMAFKVMKTVQTVEILCQQRWNTLTQEQTGSFSHLTDEIKSQPTWLWFRLKYRLMTALTESFEELRCRLWIISHLDGIFFPFLMLQLAATRILQSWQYITEGKKITNPFSET